MSTWSGSAGKKSGLFRHAISNMCPWIGKKIVEPQMLKNIIIDYETCSTEALGSVLNSVIDKFHSEVEDCLNVEVKTISNHDSLPTLDESRSINNNDTSSLKELNQDVSFSLLDTDSLGHRCRYFYL